MPKELNLIYKDKDHFNKYRNDESADDFIKWFLFFIFGDTK